jgi:hypothetical protein
MAYYPFMIENARFTNLAQALACAIVHSRQRGECQIRTPVGDLVADLVRRDDGTVSIIAMAPWKGAIEALA